MGRVGGGSPSSPFPSPELSCAGSQGSRAGRGRRAAAAPRPGPRPRAPGSTRRPHQPPGPAPARPPPAGRIVSSLFTNSVFPTPDGPSSRHITAADPSRPP